MGTGCADVAAVLYALVLVVGGWMGYKRAGSRISLLTGVSCATLYISLVILSFLIPYFAFTGMLITSLGLIGLFSFRFHKTKNMKASLPPIIGAIIVGCLSVAALIWGNHHNIWTEDTVDETYNFVY